MNNSRMLVIGGAGFIGSYLVVMELKLLESRVISKRLKKN